MLFRSRKPKYWSFSFSIIPSKEHPGLIFRMDWLDLLAAQGTLRSLLQHHSTKASILRHSTFFMVYLSHPCMTTRKTIPLTRQTFVGKVMSLFFFFNFFLELTGLISLQSKGLSRVFSNTTVQKHQFFGAQLSSQSNSHIRT